MPQTRQPHSQQAMPIALIHLAPDQYGVNGTLLDLSCLACGALLAPSTSWACTGRASNHLPPPAHICPATVFLQQCFRARAGCVHCSFPLVNITCLNGQKERVPLPTTAGRNGLLQPLNKLSSLENHATLSLGISKQSGKSR